MSTKITDHAQRAVDRLLEQYRDKPNLVALITALIAQVQELENAFYQLVEERNINTAIGAQLDVLGQIVGRAREGADDETYRIRLRAQILLNLCSGTIPQILELFELVFPTNTFELIEYFPAALELIVDEALSEVSASEALSILRTARAGGVGATITYSTEEPENTFYWNGTADQGWNAGEWAHSLEA